MESILRAAFIYIFLTVIIRISGKRTLSQLTTFDFIFLLIIGDASQQAIVGNDYSITNCAIIVITLVLIDIVLSYLKDKYRSVGRVLDGSPVILINKGEKLKDVMHRFKVDEWDILEAARKTLGLEKIELIKYAILEKDGEISIIPN